MEEYAKVEALINHTREYVQTRVDEAKLAVSEKATSVISLLVAGAVITLLFACCLLFASIAAAIGLGHQLGNSCLGFLLVAAAWLLLGCIAWMARNSIIRIPVMNALIHQLFKKEGADEKD